MWIPEMITENSEKAQPFSAVVGNAGDGKVSLSGQEGSAVWFLPYGIESVPPGGVRVLAVPTGRTLCVCGVESGNKLGLEPGEVGLFSKGGASIVLKNDGSVVINGRVF